ncbi:MAG TPA: class I SAM-dependent methyltransferase [Ktedonobacteraceae bacterium]
MREFVWSDFYKLTKDRPPWPRLVAAVDLLGRVGEALDLGCGAGRDTRYLLARGFVVTAVDREAASFAALADLSTTHLCLVQAAFEDFSFAHYDLVNAHFSLPFTHRDQFAQVFARLKASLKPDGIFVGQFLGVNDTWNTPENFMTFFTVPQAHAQLEGLEILEFTEEDQDGATADGTRKHWHVYHITARRPDA